MQTRLEEIQVRLDQLMEEVGELREKIKRESKRRRYPFPFAERSSADQRTRKPPTH